MTRACPRLVFLAGLIAGQGAGALAKDDVLAAMVDAYGGAEQLSKLTTATQIWEMEAHGGRAGVDRRYLDLPTRLRVELQYADRREVRVIDDDQGYHLFNDNPPKEVFGPRLAAMRLQKMRLYSPLQLQQLASFIELREMPDYYALTLREAGSQSDFLVRKDNFLVERVVGVVRINGAAMRFLTIYSDFRRRDGVLVHHREEKYASNVNTANLTLREVDFDPTHDASLFRPIGD